MTGLKVSIAMGLLLMLNGSSDDVVDHLLEETQSQRHFQYIFYGFGKFLCHLRFLS